MASLPCDPKEHIERIRRDKFYIGRNEKNPLAGFLHHTVGLLSEELYSKDSHFIMELIQVLVLSKEKIKFEGSHLRSISQAI